MKVRWMLLGVVLGLLVSAAAQEMSRTIPCLIARLNVADFVVDDQEIIIAINLWIAQGRVSPEIPRPISDEMMIKIIDLWVRGSDCRKA